MSTGETIGQLFGGVPLEEPDFMESPLVLANMWQEKKHKHKVS
jgi:hypothetical protein